VVGSGAQQVSTERIQRAKHIINHLQNRITMQQTQRLYKQAIRSFVMAMMVTMIAIGAQAQNPDPWDDADSADVPLDGGLSLLVAAGAGYGVKKYRDSRKQQQKQ